MRTNTLTLFGCMLKTHAMTLISERLVNTPLKDVQTQLARALAMTVLAQGLLTAQFISSVTLVSAPVSDKLESLVSTIMNAEEQLLAGTMILP